jgi:hypothetical protein
MLRGGLNDHVALHFVAGTFVMPIFSAGLCQRQTDIGQLLPVEVAIQFK